MKKIIILSIDLFYAFFYSIAFRFIIKKRHSRTVLDNFQTVKYIYEHKCSLSRFGDGELDLVIKGKFRSYHYDSGFQEFDSNLSKRLAEILIYENSLNNHLVCLPACSFSFGTSYLTYKARSFWNEYTVRNIDKLLAITNSNRLYGETNISRLYLSHKDKSKCKLFVNELKLLWKDRDIVFVEGDRTCLGVGNDLFNDAKSIRRIICPNKNAWSVYDTILNTTLKETTNKDLIILALGMTATVLAYDLAKSGRQALDLGHIDIEYEWMRMGAKEKVAVPGKFTNEAEGGKISSTSYTDEYLKQVICKI